MNASTEAMRQPSFAGLKSTAIVSPILRVVLDQ